MKGRFKDEAGERYSSTWLEDIDNKRAIDKPQTLLQTISKERSWMPFTLTFSSITSSVVFHGDAHGEKAKFLLKYLRII